MTQDYHEGCPSYQSQQFDVCIRTARLEAVEQVGELFAEMLDYHAERDEVFERGPGAKELFKKWFARQSGEKGSLALVAAAQDRLVG